MKQETIFYSRKETENEVIIKWKPYTTYGSFLYIILAFVCSQIFSKTFNSIFIILAGISFIMMIVNAVVAVIATKKVTNEARTAQQKGNCRLEGNKYSFSNPLVIHIYK
ncbi:MAG: hypothetical protein E7390_02345 [Ruminococcaceae bacterium]|nr:hypothetical protein [Oscillospiraceae bacterium]